ncbi:hypothetical protein FHS15_004084 [Paenibacillus castaneae]|uniref:copper amine oxidase N-terminal domain-containing protein n=1 Tax=Paenibacillus castaneae TaxID=474957 RepID=UPI000C9BB663|nr:copper amine oxidase N-terminal domain-containing protein [Paenibacillus castaneae]NIK78938.1 hypothetical protein [Paenibacillus castaneae]
MKQWFKASIASFAIIGLLTAASAVSAAPQSSTKVYIDGVQQKNVLTINGRTMAQLTAFHDPEKLTYSFEQATKTVVISYKAKNLVIRLKAGASAAAVNGKNVKLDAPVTIKDGRTYLPLRFLTETLGGYATFNSDTKHVIIRTPSGEERFKLLMSGDLDKARDAAIRIQPTYENKEITPYGEGFTTIYTFPKGEALRFETDYKGLLSYIEISPEGLALVKWQIDTLGQNGEAGKKPGSFGESSFFRDSFMASTLTYGTIDKNGTSNDIDVIDYYANPEYKGIIVVPIPGEVRTDGKN